MEGLIFGVIFYGNAVPSSPQIRESEFRNPGNFCLWNPRSLVLERRNTAQGIWNPINDWNSDSKFY